LLIFYFINIIMCDSLVLRDVNVKYYIPSNQPTPPFLNYCRLIILFKMLIKHVKL
jgi:hypothetical protein